MVLLSATITPTNLASANNTLTLTNKTLISPVINTPTGIVKGDVGLSDVDNTSDATKNSAAVTLTNKTLSAPILTAPVLGTPASANLIYATDLPLSTGIIGTLPVANGGTAVNTLTANNVIIGNGTGAVQFVAPSSNGNVLTSNGTNWTSTPGAAGDVVGPGSATDSALTAFDGTTGKLIKNANLTANNVIIGNGTSAPLFVAPGTNGNVLTSNGATWISSTPTASGSTDFVTQFTGANQPPGAFSPANSFALI